LIRKKPNISKVALNSIQAKIYQIIYIKAHIESTKHYNQTTFETFKKLTNHVAKISLYVLNLLQQKVTQNVTISLGS